MKRSSPHASGIFGLWRLSRAGGCWEKTGLSACRPVYSGSAGRNEKVGATFSASLPVCPGSADETKKCKDHFFCQPLPPAPPGFPGATWEGFCPPGIHIRPSVRFGPSPWRPMRNPNRSHPNVRCACVHVSGVVRESMGEISGAGISAGWFGGSGEDGAAALPVTGSRIKSGMTGVGWESAADVTPPESSRAKTRDPVCSEVGEDRRRSEGSPLPRERDGVKGALKFSARGGERGCSAPPHPPLRGTFSHEGRRGLERRV